MGFDLVDAYENLKEIKENQNYIILKIQYFEEKLISEGIIDLKDFDVWLKTKEKAKSKEVE